jgi:hypothetical protein
MAGSKEIACSTSLLADRDRFPWAPSAVVARRLRCRVATPTHPSSITLDIPKQYGSLRRARVSNAFPALTLLTPGQTQYLHYPVGGLRPLFPVCGTVKLSG